ncbi:Acetyltransferase (isoleucine patch superfamily) [Lachnospiraceae bacterium NE2001]|nr:Acetyltransferase (isoleucine patch superfamily) [Lachnospiraceae bacterium NE2001]
MINIKLLWGGRALLYKALFNNVSLPSYIGKPIFVSRYRGIKAGKRFRIYPGLRAEIIDSNSFIRIGNNVSIGQNFHVVSYDKTLYIGNDVTIAGNVFITNCDHNYKESSESVLDNSLISRDTRIGNGCFIGNNVAILAGTVLGNHCVVGANSVVRGEYPDYCVLAGNPAKIIKKRSKNGEKWEKIV